MKIYTKTGDDGTTGLLGSRRVGKDDPRIDAYGTVDELNAVLGIARAQLRDDEAETHAALGRIQEDLFAAGASLADPDPNSRFHAAIGDEQVARLEQSIDAWETDLPPLTRFVLPGGVPAAAQIHFARTVCRRAERLVVRLNHQPGEHVGENVSIYLNRLSDALFVLARHINKRSGVSDVPWRGL